jgi:hypothetical protein
MSACPDCGGTLAVARRIVLPGDRRSDEIALEIVACSCGFKAVAVSEHLQRAALRGDSSERVGYRLPKAAVDLLDFLIARCPEPAEEFCACAAHAVLNRRDLRNQWNLLRSFAPFPGFAAPAKMPTDGATFIPAPLDWTRDGEGLRATVEGREWRIVPDDSSNASWHELTIDGALGLDLDAWPPFWRVKDSGTPV